MNFKYEIVSPVQSHPLWREVAVDSDETDGSQLRQATTDVWMIYCTKDWVNECDEICLPNLQRGPRNEVENLIRI